MNKERYERLQALFQEAVELEGKAREVFLEEACAHDSQMQEDVKQLLALDGETSGKHGRSVLDRVKEEIEDAVEDKPYEMETTYSSQLPEQIGRYRILKKIGEGGMGTVYLAEQDDPRRRVALKVIRPDLFSPSLHKRFQFEVDVLGRLQHPGIAQILEAGTIETESGRFPYFAMEYVEGIGLRRYAKKHDLGVRSLLELAARICDAAHHAHLKGIVHRDLKPDNVLVVDASSTTTSNGVREFAQLGQPKVLDFGVARATDSDVQMTTMQTDIGKLVGTITYMSPEQVEGDSNLLDARSDIYALGILLYELLSGRLPFDLRNKPVPEAARIIREEEPTRLGSIRTVFRGDIDTIVFKAMEKDRERRYASAAELAADIRRYLANEPITAHPPSTFYQLRKFARRNKGLVAGLALAFLILVAGIISSLTFALRATRGEQRALRSEEHALLSETEARLSAYRLSLTAADAVGDTDPLRALNHLETIPSKYRGWEWQHLWARFTPHLSEYRADEQSASRHRHRQDNFYFHLRVTACRADGSLIAARMGKGQIELFDPVSGDVISQFDTAGDDVAPILSPDGSHLAGVSLTKEKLIVWKIRPKARLFEIPVVPANVGDVCFSPDSSLLVLTSKENTQLIEVATGRCRFRTAPYPTNSGQAVFSRDGSRFALHGYNWGESQCGGDEYYLCIYNTSGDCLVHSQGRMGGGNCAMAFSPDGTRLAIGQEQRSIRFLDAATLEDQEEFHGHTGLISALVFSESGESMTSASAGGTICIWDLAHGARPRVFTGLPSDLGATSVTYSRNGERLIAGNYQGIRSWDLNRTACSILKGHSSYVYRVIFSPDGSLIASAGYDNSVCLWDGLTIELLSILPVRESRYFLFFTPDGSRLIGKSILESATGIELTEPRLPTDKPLIEAIAETYKPAESPFPPRRLRFAAGGTKVYAHEMFALSWDRSLVADGRKKDVLQIHDRITGKTVKQIKGHGSFFVSVAFSPDTTKIVTGHENGLVKVWDLESGQELATLNGHTSKVYSVNYNPEASRIASGSNDNNIIIWDATAYEQVAVLRGHTSYVHSVCFSPDGTKLASASGDGTVRIWDSVPPADRWEQIQQDMALRREAEPIVDQLFTELGDPLDVADRLRDDSALSGDLRSAALRVLLKRSAAKREDKPQ